MQDEGSQLAALMAGAGPRKQVLDLCAGAGGKTLAFAALMRNTGQVYAYDDDTHRQRPIFERLKRAGVRNVQVLAAGDEAALRDLGPRFDVVCIDAPCTGTGAWRRPPTASLTRCGARPLQVSVSSETRRLARSTSADHRATGNDVQDRRRRDRGWRGRRRRRGDSGCGALVDEIEPRGLADCWQNPTSTSNVSD